MFPTIRSGVGNSTAPDTNTVFVQSLICSALNEIAKQAIIDTSILTFHQMEVQVYALNERGVQIPEDAEGNLLPFSEEEEKQLKDNLREVVWKYHILNPNGLVTRLTPLINCIQNGVAVPEEVAAADPFIYRVLSRHSNYTQSVYSGNISEMLNNILNFTEVDEMTEDEHINLIRASRDDGDEYVSVAVYEDDSVQCGCDYCERFFETLEIQVNHEDLNFLQRTMMQYF